MNLYSKHQLENIKFYEIFPLAILGVVAGLVASLYMRGLTGFVPIPKKIPVYLLPIIAGTICGIVGLFLPETLGLGTNFIRKIIEKPIAIDYVALLFAGKLFLTVVCIRLNLFGEYFLLHCF